jgi:hypothetical protein
MTFFFCKPAYKLIALHPRSLNIPHFSAAIMIFFQHLSSLLSPLRKLVAHFSPFYNKSSSKMSSICINGINYAHYEQVFYDENVVHLQLDCEVSSLF